MKKEMKQVLWVVALLVILMTATGNLVSAAGFDRSDGTFGNACKKVYSVSFRSGRGASSAIYEKLEKKQKYGSMITIPKVPQRGSTKNRRCEDVRTFNSGLAGELGSQYHYIDVYSYLMRTGYGTVSNTGDGTDDGVHYTPKTYKRIFTFCLNNIRKTENYFNIEDVGS